MDHCLVASITQLDCAPVCLVEQRLPHFSGCVGLAVHHTAITENDGGLLGLERRLQEDVLKAHLTLHDLDLKADLVHQGHLVGLDEAATFHHERGSFGD